MESTFWPGLLSCMQVHNSVGIYGAEASKESLSGKKMAYRLKIDNSYIFNLHDLIWDVNGVNNQQSNLLKWYSDLFSISMGSYLTYFHPKKTKYKPAWLILGINFLQYVWMSQSHLCNNTDSDFINISMCGTASNSFSFTQSLKKICL